MSPTGSNRYHVCQTNGHIRLAEGVVAPSNDVAGRPQFCPGVAEANQKNQQQRAGGSFRLARSRVDDYWRKPQTLPRQ